MRIAIFVDGAYLLKQLPDPASQPDFGRLTEYLLAPLAAGMVGQPLDLMRSYFYYCAPWVSDNPTPAERRRLAIYDRFIGEIQQSRRWQVRLGKLERRREGDKETFAQKRVDVQLTVDLVRHVAAGHIQHVVLLAGDSDFIPAIDAAKELGATVSLWCDKDKSVHRDLMAHSDEVHFFDWQRFPLLVTKPAALDTATSDSEGAGEPPRPRRGRGRRGGGGAKAASTVPEVPPSEAAPSEVPPSEVLPRTARQNTAKPAEVPSAHSSPETLEHMPQTPRPPARSSSPRATPRPAGTARAAASPARGPTAPVTSPATVASPDAEAEEPGDNVGNVRPEGEAQGPQKKSGRRRRRGGRGRGRGRKDNGGEGDGAPPQ